MANDIRHRYITNPRIANKLFDELRGKDGEGVMKIRRLTKAEYDAMPTHDETTLYLFTDGEGE